MNEFSSNPGAVAPIKWEGGLIDPAFDRKGNQLPVDNAAAFAQLSDQRFQGPANSALHRFNPGDRVWHMEDNRAVNREVVVVKIFISPSGTKIELNLRKTEGSGGNYHYDKPENICFRNKEMLLATL